MQKYSTIIGVIELRQSGIGYHYQEAVQHRKQYRNALRIIPSGLKPAT